MIHLIFVLLLSCCNSLLFGDERLFLRADEILSSSATPMANIDGEPSAFVHGCVNTITGDFIDQQRDLVLPGANPLVLDRFYCSSDDQLGPLFHGWHHHLWGALSQQFSSKHNHIVTKGGGGHYVFKEHIHKNHRSRGYYELGIDPKMLQKGVTNCRGGEVSGRTNIKNVGITVESPGANKREPDSWEVVDGAGVSHRYWLRESRVEGFQPDSLYLLGKIIKPTGERLIIRNFNHVTGGCLAENKAGIETNRILFTPVRDEMLKAAAKGGHPLCMDAISDQGGKVHYEFKYFEGKNSRNKKRFRLTKVERSHAPWEKYTYSKPDHDLLERVIRKERPDGRFIEIEYYKKGENKGKVKELRVPGIAAPEQLYRFEYKERSRGETHVFDRNNNKSVYQHCLDTHRLLSIDKYEGEQLYSREKLKWDGESQLTCRSLEDREGNLIFSKTYSYDERGNILEETLKGNLGDCKSIFNSYSNDGLNLLEEAKEGPVTLIYKYGENLVEAKYLLFEGAIKIREFFAYDVNNALTLHIIDDGSSWEQNDFSGVTERKVKKIRNSNQNPFGLPLEIWEYCVDIPSRQELLLKHQLHERDHWGRITATTVQSLYTTRYQYNEHGLISSSTNALGKTTTYRYDANDNKIFEQSPLWCKHYHYDCCNRLIQEELHSDSIRITKHRYDLLGNKIATLDPQGNETSFTYDGLNRLIKTLYPAVPDETGVLTRPAESYTYDLLGHLSSITDAKGSTQIKNTILGKPYFKQYPDGTTEHFEYTSRGDLIKSVDKEGVITTQTYDYLYRPCITEVYSAGELLKRIVKEYNAFHLIKESDGEGVVTHYLYDSAGRLARIEKEGRKCEMIYDAMGREAERRDYLNDQEYISRKTYYDYLDQILCKKTEELTLLEQVEYGYDDDGNCTEVKQELAAGKALYQITYDAEGREVASIDPLGNKTETFYRDVVDRFGIKVCCRERIDPLGNSTITTYDALNRVASVKRLNPQGALVQQQEYFYDLSGNLCREMHDVIIEGIVQKQSILTRKYDALNRLVEQREAAGTPDEKVTRYLYSPNGWKTKVIKPDGMEVNYSYDALGRCIEELSLGVHYRTQYDKNDRPLVSEDLIHGCTTKRSYNKTGELVKETLGNGATLSYRYDKLGRRLFLVYPDHSRICYAYQGDFLKEVTRLSSQGTYRHRYNSYDLTGTLLEEELPGSCGKTSFTYDLCSRYLKIESPEWKETFFAYDPVGNLLNRTSSEILCSYSYDDLYQLSSETGIATHVYRYDSLYNRTQCDSKKEEHNELNQLLGNRYDLNGNLIETPNASYFYDGRDRLIKIEKAGKDVTFTYDAFNRCLSRNEKGDIENYFYDQQQEIGSFESDGSLKELKVMGRDRAIAIEIGKNVYVPLHDSCGSIVSLLNLENGHVAEGYRFSAFGIEQTEQMPLNPWRYAGKRVDTGLSLFGERFYDPELGRWINPDPLGFADGPNLYAYVKNNPLVFKDPTGLFCMPMMALPAFELDSFKMDPIKMESLQPKSDMNLFKTFKNSYEDVRLGAVGFLDYKYAGGWLNAHFANEDTVSVVLNLIDSFSDNPTTLEELKERYSDRAISILQGPPEGVSLCQMPSPGGLLRKTVLPCLNKLSKAGQVMDRGGLTKAGRALDKHGNRLNSPFPKASGNPTSKNMQGQFQLDDMLTHPNCRMIISDKGDIRLYTPDGRGAHFRSDKSFKGFLDYE